MTVSNNSKNPSLRPPMPVKYWSRAGIMLCEWCNASCACCYANCSSELTATMDADAAIDIWRQLAELSPHGCRVHLTGGEVFANLELLMSVCEKYAASDIADKGGELEAIETNGFWASDSGEVRSILRQLDRLGMQKISISCDPYHQQFVPIEHVRLLVSVAREVLGEDRIKVRQQQWLDDGYDLFPLAENRQREILLDYAAEARERFTGRAADGLDEKIEKFPCEKFTDNNCRGVLLRGKHVHIAPTGEIWPATCVGISAGNVFNSSVGELWQNLYDNFSQIPVIKDLAADGPVGLLDECQALGYQRRPGGYASKCQLCFDLRRFLHCRGQMHEYLGPSVIYSPPK